MCWNQDISINTFLFICFTLLFIFITNRFSKYKTHTFDNPLAYLLLLEVASMQLTEFFLWRNLQNKSMNQLLSSIVSFIITIQPLTIMLMIPNMIIKSVFIILYIILIKAYFMYSSKTKHLIFNTSVGKNGHLSWEFMNFKGYENIFLIIYLSLYVISLLLINSPLLAFFTIFSLIISLIFYYKYKTFGTMWCWTFNIFLLYFIVNIIIIQPYYEYNGLC